MKRLLRKSRIFDSNKQDLGRKLLIFLDTASFFVPALLLLGLGVMALVAPKLLGAIVASIFLFLGALFCFLTWKVLKFKKKFEGMFKGMNNQFVIKTYAVPPEKDLLKEFNPRDDKKIIIH